MKKPKLPSTDSIQKLADFWDTHDLTDFEDQLEEVPEPVFARDTIKVHLESRAAKAVAKLAKDEGVSQEELIRKWVLQKLSRRTKGRSGTGRKLGAFLKARSKEPATTSLEEYRRSLGKRV